MAATAFAAAETALTAMTAPDAGLCCRQNVDAFVAMRMVMFPVPPMPVVANQGEDGRDGTASSADLLAAALRCQLLQPDSRGDAALTAAKSTGEAKRKLLVAMFREVAAAQQQHRTGALTAAAALEQCYAIWQRTFRQYFAFFPGSPDLRFRPLGDVGRGSAVHAQAAAFLRSQAFTIVDDGGVLTDLAASGGADRSYAQILQRYAEELHAQAQDASEDY